MDYGKIKLGYLDVYKTYKIGEFSNSDKYIKKISKLKCVVSEHNYEGNDVIYSLKKDFKQFTEDELSKDSKAIKEQIDKITSETNILNELSIDIQTCIGERKSLLNERISMTIGQSDGGESSIKFTSGYLNFVEKNLLLMCNIMEKNVEYLGKSVGLFMEAHICQPIVLKLDGKNSLINVKLLYYSSGTIIIQYTIPINEYKFNHVINSPINKTVSFDKIYLPRYIIAEEDSYDYSSKEYNNFDQAIDDYDRYIIGKLKKNKISGSYFTNYTLCDYDNIPTNFQAASYNLKYIIYWIVNKPFGFFNDIESNKVKNRWDNEGYDYHKYFRIYISSVGRSVFLFNQDILKLQEYGLPIRKDDLYDMAMIYISAALESVLIKKSYYQSFLSTGLTFNKPLRKIYKEREKLIRIDNLIFSITNGSYGSVKKLQQYIENGLTDFLPSGFLSNELESYERAIEIKKSNQKDNTNFFMTFLAMLFPIIFGFEAVGKTSELVDKRFGTHIQWFSFATWIGIIIIIIVFLISDKIKIAYRKIKLTYYTIKIIYHKIKALFKS